MNFKVCPLFYADIFNSFVNASMHDIIFPQLRLGPKDP